MSLHGSYFARPKKLCSDSDEADLLHPVASDLCLPYAERQTWLAQMMPAKQIGWQMPLWQS